MKIKDTTEYAETATKAIDDKSSELRTISLKIHENPELAYKEKFAHGLLVKYLQDQGFNVTPSAYGLETAFVAEFQSIAGRGRVVSFNSEYDALPKIGHACGHNLIAISGVAAAIALKTVFEKYQIPGTVKLFGTPAEGNGKIDLVNAGAYNDVDISLMVHPSPFDGCFIKFLALQSCEVKYFGRTAHAAGAPWEGINALDATILAYNNIGLLRQQILPTNRIHGIITNGGEAPNIIPDNTSSEYFIRGRTIKDLTDLRPRVHKCFEAAAIAAGCTKENGAKDPSIFWKREVFDVKTNVPLGNRYEEHLKKFGITFPTKEEQDATPAGSTDQGRVTYLIPGIHAMFDIKPPKGSANHTPGFTDAAKTEFAHEATLTASKGIALTGIDYLVDDCFARLVKLSFDGHLNDGEQVHVYRWPINYLFTWQFWTTNLLYPTIYTHNWPEPQCSLIVGCFFFVSITNILLVGMSSAMSWLIVCKKVYLSFGKYDWKLFVIPFGGATVLTIISASTNEGFCILRKIASTEFDHNNGPFLKASKKVLGYLLMYIVQWTPLMVYVIADILNVASYFIAAGGILNMVQYIINEGWKDIPRSPLTNRDSCNAPNSIKSTDVEGRNRNWNYILKINIENDEEVTDGL
ncbi:20741_t:CDS:10 [Funneliformis geosporum]|nr:20741_t:CDS:10 [Funneliformis geosporum]